MVRIHPSAIVDPAAELGEDVEIGPFAIVEAGARLGDGCRIGPHAMIHSRTTLGPRNLVHMGAELGGDAQHLRCHATETFLEIGSDNVFREYVTIHRATVEGGATRVGDHNYLMGFVHLGHDVVLGNHTMIANQVAVGGHVQIDDRVVVGGLAAFHQWTRVGRMAMIGGLSGVVTDVPPFCLAAGLPARIEGINTVGLRRNGIPTETRTALRKVVQRLFLSKSHRGRTIEAIEAEGNLLPEVVELLEFVKASRNRRFGRQLEQ